MPDFVKEPQFNAIFGGTFDPPHFGHLRPLQETADILALSHVGLMPSNVPALKKGTTEPHHRIEMTRLLCELDPRFAVNLTEFKRDSVSYTVNTLKLIKEIQPNQTIIFIIGLDSLYTLHQWHEWEQLFDYCHLVVMLRPPLNSKCAENTVSKPVANDLASNLYDFYTSKTEFESIVGNNMNKLTRLSLLSKLARAENNQHSINQQSFKDIIENSAKGNLWFIKNHVLPVSSTEIRRRIKTGEPVNDLVPQSVLDYIHKYQLYKFK